MNGALAQADVLGIFGREGLDLATLWAAPIRSILVLNWQPGAFAFRMYRNYDGQGAAFGDTSVAASSADQGQLASLRGAARRRWRAHADDHQQERRQPDQPDQPGRLHILRPGAGLSLQRAERAADCATGRSIGWQQLQRDLSSQLDHADGAAEAERAIDAAG